MEEEWVQIKDLQRVRLEPGDVLVVRIANQISPAELERWTNRLQAVFSKNQVIAVAGKADFFVVGADA
jgi:hypothetical protein